LKYFFVLIAALAPLVAGPAAGSAAKTPVYGYRVVNTLPHDPRAFTQGFEIRGGVFYEGTGLNGRSTLRRVDVKTGEVILSTPLPQRFFGEGITVLDGHIYQLTWQAQEGFVYSQTKFELEKTFQYPGEGWGLTNDGKRIFMSDGSAEIRIWNGTTLKEERRIKVHDGAEAISNLNELEWVKGEIYANIWQTDRIARISPVDGHVIAWIDLSGILPPGDHDVLNGIAYDAASDRLFITGKLWPKVFEIKLVLKK